MDAQLDIRIYMFGMERRHRLTECPFLQKQKRLFCQILHSDITLFSKGMLCGKHGHKRIFLDQMGLYPCNGIRVDKSKINLPDTYPLGNCSIVPLMKYELHIRILNLKFFDQLRKPMSRYTGKCTDLNHTGLQPFDFLNHLLHGMVLCHCPLDERIQLFPF